MAGHHIPARGAAGTSPVAQARETYSPLRVSTRTVSPSSLKSGTRTVTPDSTAAGLPAPRPAPGPLAGKEFLARAVGDQPAQRLAGDLLGDLELLVVARVHE